MRVRGDRAAQHREPVVERRARRVAVVDAARRNEDDAI